MAHRRLILPIVVAIASLLSSIGAITAQNDPNVAALLIDTGDGEPIMVSIAFTEDELPAIELLHRSGLPVLTVAFGGLGEGVCMIEATGCDITTCRRTLCQTGADAPFWQFLTRDGDSDWTTSPLGASNVTVNDGDTTAWLWTTDSPDSLAESFDSIVERTGEPSIDSPARFPAPSNNTDRGDLRTPLIGAAMIALTAAFGLALLMRSRRAPR